MAIVSGIYLLLEGNDPVLSGMQYVRELTYAADIDALRYVAIDSGVHYFYCHPSGGTGGEANTASNLGSGSGIYAYKSGVDLKFKSIVPGNNTYLCSNSDEIEIGFIDVSGSLTGNGTPTYIPFRLTPTTLGDSPMYTTNGDVYVAQSVIIDSSVDNPIIGFGDTSGNFAMRLDYDQTDIGELRMAGLGGISDIIFYEDSSHNLTIGPAYRNVDGNIGLGSFLNINSIGDIDLGDLHITSSGNMGLGVVPTSGWASPAFQLGITAISYDLADGQTLNISNGAYNGGDVEWISIETEAALYSQGFLYGSHQFKFGVASSGIGTSIDWYSYLNMASDVGIVFNPDALQMFFTVKGDNDQHLIETDGDSKVGIGRTPSRAKLDILSTTAQQSLMYSPSYYADFTVNASGKLDIAASSGEFSFSYDSSYYLDINVDSAGQSTISPNAGNLNLVAVSDSYINLYNKTSSKSLYINLFTTDADASDAVLMNTYAVGNYLDDNYSRLMVGYSGNRYMMASDKDGSGAHYPILISAAGNSVNQLYLATNGLIGLNTNNPARAQLDIKSTGDQLSLLYDDSNYADFTVNNSGNLAISSVDNLTLTPGVGKNLIISTLGAGVLQSNVYGIITSDFYFGTQNTSAESLGVSSTTSTSYIQKLKLTTPSIPAGNYMINWSADLGNSSTKVASKMQVQVDDTTTLAGSQIDFTESNGYAMQAGHAIVALTAAVHTIDIDYSILSAGTANIRNARLTIWRIS